MTVDVSRLGEVKVMARLVELGWYPFSDLSGKCPVDIIAWKNGSTKLFQVKTTSTKSASGKYVVQIGAVRSNRTANVIHKFDNTSVDYLAVYVKPEDKIVFLLASSITTGRAYTLQNMDSSTLAC